MDPEYLHETILKKSDIHVHVYPRRIFASPPHSCVTLRMDHHQCNCFFVFAFTPLVEIKNFTIHVNAFCVELVSLRTAFETDGFTAATTRPLCSVDGNFFRLSHDYTTTRLKFAHFTKSEEIP